MAEGAAHFTATLEAKPSIFEIVAQNSLNSIFHPALQKVASFLALVNPQKFQWLVDHYEEVFLALNGLLQYHYIKTKGASFSEYFYGLQRVTTSGKSLSQQQERLSLVFLIVLPYLKRKFEGKLQIYRIQNAEGLVENDVSGLCKKAILASHSAYEISFKIWTLVQYLRYMSDQSTYQSPVLQILNLRLVYLMELERPAFWIPLVMGQLSLREFGTGISQNFLQNVLELSAFFVQFLQVWNVERPNYSFSSLPTVAPPPKDNNAVNYKEKCPLCLQNWKIPTVLPVSGYVFCFPCIIRHLREHSRCPVTNLPAKPLDLVRLYDSTE